MSVVRFEKGKPRRLMNTITFGSKYDLSTEGCR